MTKFHVGQIVRGKEPGSGAAPNDRVQKILQGELFRVKEIGASDFIIKVESLTGKKYRLPGISINISLNRHQERFESL